MIARAAFFKPFPYSQAAPVLRSIVASSKRELPCLLIEITLPSVTCNLLSQSLSPLVHPQRLPCFRFSQLSPDRLPAITPPSHTCNLLSQSLKPLVRSQGLPCTQLNPNPHPPQLQFADARLEIEDCADSVGTTVSVVIGVPSHAVCTCKRSWLSAAASKQSSLPLTHPRVHSSTQP
jgi:hypothetical protein